MKKRARHEKNPANSPNSANPGSDNELRRKEFIITTPEQLAGLAKLVNKGNNFAGKFFVLEQDIAFNDTTNWHNWVENPPEYIWKRPIGSSNWNTFCGTFDGNGFQGFLN
jgi:hypothetical protein